MKAYFSYVNARRARAEDRQDGVASMGRQIICKYYDDGYQPGEHGSADAQARRAGQGLRRPSASSARSRCSAARAYMNQQKVPQALVSTGASYWGTQYKEFPWTTGWQPDYIAEGRLYGLHVKANFSREEDRDRVPERRLRKGLPLRLPRSARQGSTPMPTSSPRRRSRPTATSVASKMVRVRASGAHGPRGLPAPEADDPHDRDRPRHSAINPEQIYMNSVAAIKPAMDGMVAAAGAPYINGIITIALRQGSARTRGGTTTPR